MGRAALLVVVSVLTGCVGPYNFYDHGELLLTPAELDFGDLVVGEDAEMLLAVRNIGAAEALFFAELVDGTDSFTLADACVEHTTLEAISTGECRVRAAPPEAGEHTGTLRLLSNAVEPEIIVPLSVNGIAPEVHAASTSCDLGQVVYPCTSQIELSVSNQGSAPLQVFGIEVVGAGDEISASHDWGGGIDIGHDQEAVFSVHYEPVDLAPDVATVTVLTNDPVTPEVAFTCTGEARLTDAVTETFTQHPSAADFLWVVDNSPDSLALQEKLAAEFPPFLDTLVSHGIDYHLAVVTTETDAFQGPHPVMDPVTVDVDKAFADAVLARTHGTYTEQPLKYGSQAITPPLAAPGGENDGFVREDARLRVIFVSDADDDSPDTVTAYVNLFQSLKVDPDWVVAHGVTGQLAGCTGDWIEAESAQRLEQTFSLTDGYSGSVCETDWTTMLTELAEVSSELVDTFGLGEDPDLTTSPTVAVDGVEATIGWTYEAILNAVVFDADHVPSPGATVTVTYIPLFEC